MKETPLAYIPRDRLESLSRGGELPSKSRGSILFADISGFTPLTEAYELYLGARKGGEELARILNEVYNELIAEVDRNRGSVIGFAGDAITCWYEEDKGMRAVKSALSMQDKMKHFQRIASPAGGTIAIGLKAAITTGNIRRYTVGNSHIQKTDVIAGEPVYRVAELEQLAERGMVVVDDETKRHLAGMATFEGTLNNPSTGLTAHVAASIVKTDDGVAWQSLMESEIPESITDGWIITPVKNLLNSGLSDFITELRPATALFVKFGGIDFENDPEAGLKLDEYYSGIQAIVADFDGIVLQLTVGDKGSYLYAAFGAPVSHEDDTRRAMTVALEIRNYSNKQEFIESVQIGIGRGTTRTGAYGGVTRRTYGVLGDQVNLAARLMAMANPGEILISEAVRRDSGKGFQLKELEPVQVKGKKNPEQVYELIDLQHHHPRLTINYNLPMIGRRKHAENIISLLKGASSGKGCVVALRSEAGLGKTRLIHECIQKLEKDGFRLFLGECQAFGANSAYTPWWTVWRDYFASELNYPDNEVQQRLETRLNEIDESLGPRTPLLSPVLNIPLVDNELTSSLEPKLRRASMEGLLIECLRNECNKQPVLIMLDDIHAMDGISAQLLRAIIQAIARIPVAIVLAGRPEESDQVITDAESSLEYYNTIQLGELSQKDCSEFIEAKVRQLRGPDAVVPEHLVKRITSRTGGNPFYMDEVLNWIIERGIDFQSATELNRVELPGSLHSLVLSRMDQLDENPRITMKVASVIGKKFKASFLWGVYPKLGQREDVLKSLDKLSRNDFTELSETEPELLYLFKHVLVQEVAYESLPTSLKEQLHEAIGNHIELIQEAESMQTLDLLAFHFSRSANLEKKKSYLLRAGNYAKGAYLCESARFYLEEVLPMTEESEKGTVLRDLGHVLEILGDWEKSMLSYKQAHEHSIQVRENSLMANCQLDIGDLLRKMGSFEEAGAWFARAEENFQKLEDEEGIGQVLHSAGTLAAQTGDYQQADEKYSRSLDIRKKLGNEQKVASLLSNMGIVERFQGNVDKALRLQNQSLDIRKKLKDPYFLAISFNNLGMVKRDLGNLEGARLDLEESSRIFRQIGDRAELSNALNSLAEVALVQEDTKACEGFLLESIQLVRELGNLRGLAFLFETFAYNAYLQQDFVRSLRLFGAAKSLREEIGAPLPESDQENIGNKIMEISKKCPELDAIKEIEKGATLAVSAAIDYAESLES